MPVLLHRLMLSCEYDTIRLLTREASFVLTFSLETCAHTRTLPHVTATSEVIKVHYSKILPGDMILKHHISLHVSAPS